MDFTKYGGGIMKIGSVVVHCCDFDGMVAFWQAALRYVPREPAKEDWVVLCDPDGNGPNMSFQAHNHGKWRRSWIHLDLYTDDQEGEVKRLLSLGAHNYAWKYPPRADYVVLEDPDGNLFCVIQSPKPSM